MKLRRVLTYVLIITLGAVFMTACGSAMNDAAKLTEYDIGGEKVPSLTSVVGERKVSALETGTNNGAEQKQYTYDTDTVQDDVVAYFQSLQNGGYLVTQDFTPETVPGLTQLARESSKEGHVIVVSIAFEEKNIAVKLTDMETTLTPNQ